MHDKKAIPIDPKILLTLALKADVSLPTAREFLRGRRDTGAGQARITHRLLAAAEELGLRPVASTSEQAA